MVAMLIGGLPYAILVYPTYWFTCPRCHRKFFLRYLYIDPFVTKCRHCQLPLWSDESEFMITDNQPNKSPLRTPASVTPAADAPAAPPPGAAGL